MKRFVLYTLFVSYAFTLLSVDDQAHAVPLIAAHNAGAGAPIVQVPIAAQIPAQPAVAQNPWRSRAIMTCIVASLLTAIITPIAITFSQKPQQRQCINANDDMTDQCYYVSICWLWTV